MVLIAYSFGVVDVDMMFQTGALIAVTMSFGLLTESSASRETNLRPRIARLLPHFLGWIPMIAAWIPPIRRYVDAVKLADGNTPDFVTAILIVELVLFSCFGLVQIWHLWVVNPVDGRPTIHRTLLAEQMYLVLSLAAKVSLTWLVAAIVFF